MNVIEELEKEQLRDDIPEFKPGDTVRLSVRVIEGGKERIQQYEGVVIKRQNSGIRETFTVRRAKLYYLRNLTGKAARIKDIR